MQDIKDIVGQILTEQDAAPKAARTNPMAYPADSEMAALLTRWKDRILLRAGINIETHFKDSPVEDFSPEELGFERGIRTAVTEVCKLMTDPSYFGRKPNGEFKWPEED